MQALGLARLVGASITLLHCVEELHPGSLLEQKRFRKLHAEAVQLAEHKLAEIARREIKPHVAVKCLVKQGKPSEAIAALASKCGCQLIVMGTHGRTGLKHALLGSVTERVIRLASCPVMTVRG